MNVIEISDVSFRVGSKILLENIDLTVRKGEFLGLLGPNGAGKSTLLNLMNSSLHPGTGELRIFGETPSSPGGAGIWEICRRIAFVPQSLDFNPAVPLTAREVVEMARSGRRGPLHALTPEDHDIARSSMERLGVLNLAKRTYRSLSGGERQKVQLARALAQEPDLLLLDEPTVGLDMDWQERLVEIIGELFQDLGLTICMSTHITSHLPSCCNRAILLREGRMLYDGSFREALTPERLGGLFDCPVRTIEQRGRIYCIGEGVEQ